MRNALFFFRYFSDLLIYRYLEVGSKIRMLYEENQSGTLCIRRAVLLTSEISRENLLQFMELRN